MILWLLENKEEKHHDSTSIHGPRSALRASICRLRLRSASLGGSRKAGSSEEALADVKAKPK
ncbi:hypothetical protein BJX64DRAFT_247027 [Aspergillus heterothallicus]